MMRYRRPSGLVTTPLSFEFSRRNFALASALSDWSAACAPAQSPSAISIPANDLNIGLRTPQHAHSKNYQTGRPAFQLLMTSVPGHFDGAVPSNVPIAPTTTSRPSLVGGAAPAATECLSRGAGRRPA